ncbi:carbon monoxide dehydrogenase subunit G [Rhizobium sp. 2YAF20]|uniref:SRPBCC family protein n=1 Tax=Rhizobium sp. 2YAF20 TaxID=3233027 RepID=UPI003F9C1A57
MDMTGEERIAAPRDVVWVALNDPEIIKQCIPRCESFERISPTQFVAVFKVRVGPLSASFNGEVTLSNVNGPESYTISAEGKGGIAGFAKGGADVVLTPDDSETVLQYEARGEIGGRIAQLGSRLIASSAKKLAQQFFSDFNAVVSIKTEA